MEFELTREQKRVRKDIACFAKEQLEGSATPEKTGTCFPRDLWKRCAEMKITGLHIPDSYGGLGYGPIDIALSLEALGSGCSNGSLLAGLAAQLFLCETPIHAYGTEAQKTSYLPGLIDGSSIAASAFAEATTSAEYSAIACEALQQEDSFVLSGEKLFSINAPVAQVFLIYARTAPHTQDAPGITCFIVDRDAEGLSVEALEKQAGSPRLIAGKVTLDGVRVSSNGVLGDIGKGNQVYEKALQWERSLLGALYVGQLERILNACIKESRTRIRGDKPTGKRQSVSHAITDMKIRLEVSRLLSRQAAWNLTREHPDTISAPLTKLYSSESLLQSTIEAVHIFGDFSLLEPLQLGSALENAIDSNLFGGSPQSQRSAIAHALGMTSA